jgi:hypothetical protein
MGSQPNPLAGGGQSSPMGGMLMQALAAKTGATGGGEGSGDPATEYASQVSELQGADPGMLLQQLNQIQKLLGVIFVQTIQRLPNVGGQISKVMNVMTKAIKETQQAASTASAIGKGKSAEGGGINFSAAQPTTGAESGAGGASGQMFGAQ